MELLPGPDQRSVNHNLFAQGRGYDIETAGEWSKNPLSNSGA